MTLRRLTLVQGDITAAQVDVLVNAWNRNFIPYWLLIPQGVAGALRRRAGRVPFREVGRAGLLPLGGLVETSSGELSEVGAIFHVAALHAYWRSSERAVELAAAEVFRRAELRGVESLAIPLLGSGTGGVDPAASFRIIQKAWRDGPYRPGRTEIYVFESEVYIELLRGLGWEESFEHLKSGAFWDAHEGWEEIWSLLPESPAREAVQVLIQIAAACHKLDQAATREPAGMQRGMRALLVSAGEHLERARLPGSPEPGFSLSAVQKTLDELHLVLEDWQGGQSIEELRGRAMALGAGLAGEISGRPLLKC